VSTAKTSTTGEAAASLEGPMEHKGGLVQTVSGSLVLSRGPGAVGREKGQATDVRTVTADYGSRHDTTHPGPTGSSPLAAAPTGAHARTTGAALWPHTPPAHDTHTPHAPHRGLPQQAHTGAARAPPHGRRRGRLGRSNPVAAATGLAGRPTRVATGRPRPSREHCLLTCGPPARTSAWCLAGGHAAALLACCTTSTDARRDLHPRARPVANSRGRRARRRTGSAGACPMAALWAVA
jgi:hypothetical protein